MESFIVAANTVNIVVGTSTANVPVRNGMPGQPSTVLLTNVGTAVVFVAFGDSAVTASLTTSKPLLPNSDQSFSLPASATHIAAIAAGAGSTLYATPGEGL